MFDLVHVFEIEFVGPGTRLVRVPETRPVRVPETRPILSVRVLARGFVGSNFATAKPIPAHNTSEERAHQGASFPIALYCR